MALDAGFFCRDRAEVQSAVDDGFASAYNHCAAVDDGFGADARAFFAVAHGMPPVAVN